MGKQALEIIGDRFLAREYFPDETEFQKAVSKLERDFRKRYLGYEIEVEDLKRGVFITIRDSPQTAARRKVVEKLFLELTENVPDWRLAPSNSTAKQLEMCCDEAFKKVHFKQIWNYIQHHPEGLKLKAVEISDGLWFKLILFEIYGIKKLNSNFYDWNDKIIFDVSDDALIAKLTDIEHLLKVRRNKFFCTIDKCYFFKRIVEIRDFLELLEKTGF